VVKLGSGHTSSVQSVYFSQDDTKVFSLGIDKQLIIWEVKLQPSGGMGKSSAKILRKIKTKYCRDMVFR
jgi:WD40 repeat protein